MHIDILHANTIDEIIRIVLSIEKVEQNNLLYFRGETKDRMEDAVSPSAYREHNLKSEHTTYREMQRFNDHEFASDKTTFDVLARIQHYEAPTRLIDISEDVLSALYFALDKKESDNSSVLYIFEIDENKIKYYDSDAVSVIANLSKSPLKNSDNPQKSKEAIHSDARNYLHDKEGFNRQESVKFLLHDIKREKSYFQEIIQPKHLFSILCVKPKYTNQRILGQKGAFLLFGMAQDSVEKSIQLFERYGEYVEFNKNLTEEYHPIRKITKIVLSPEINSTQLEKLGITKPYIYPEMDKVSDFLKTKVNS